MQKKRSIILMIILAILLLSIGVFYGMIQTEHVPVPERMEEKTPSITPSPSPSPVPEVVTVYKPTCMQAGYELHENLETGITRVVDGEPALGHDLSSDGVCVRCGYAETSSEAKTGVPKDISANAIPRINLKGDMTGISKDKRIVLGFDFASAQQQFSCYSFTTWQGHSSIEYPKKNYTARLFVDQQITEKYRLIFNDWQLEHKYILKANYMDVSQVRNLIAARLWGDMAASRSGLHETLRNSSNYGAVDGFPVAVYHDDAFMGLYTMNLHKDEDLYGMREGRREAVVIANGQTMDESLFRASAIFEEDVSDWELEFCGTPDQTLWAQECFNELIHFVMNSSDEQFRGELQKHLDVNSAIDYLLFIYATGLKENSAKDLVLIRYEDSPWIATVYDMECAFGLNPEGTEFVSAQDFLPVKEDGVWDSGTGSMLWDRLLQTFESEIAERWQMLRNGVLAQEALLAQAQSLINAIPEQELKMDMKLYPDRLIVENPGEQIMTYIQQRLVLLDSIFSPGAK